MTAKQDVTPKVGEGIEKEGLPTIQTVPFLAASEHRIAL
jgi:hypothetical protein